jgi:hypothetical protein
VEGVIRGDDVAARARDATAAFGGERRAHEQERGEERQDGLLNDTALHSNLPHVSTVEPDPVLDSRLA